jgi:hypothetical protein
MCNFACLMFLLVSTTKELAAFLEHCHCSDDDCFEKSARAFRAILTDEAEAKRRASLVSILMLHTAFEASIVGREVHWLQLRQSASMAIWLAMATPNSGASG